MVSFESHISLTRNYFFRSLPLIFPDIDKIIALSKAPSGEISGLELTRENNSYREKELFADGLKDLFVPEKERALFTWIHKENLPFEKTSKNSGQLDLFSEREYIVLSVKITVNVIDGDIVDIYYLFFRKDQSNFGISRVEGIFDTSLKAVAGSMLSKYIVFFYDYANNERAKFNNFKNETKELLRQNEQQNDKSLLLNMVRQWATDYLNNYERPAGINFLLPEQTIQILAAQDFQTARKMLDKAAYFSLMLHSDSHQSEIEILHTYLSNNIIENEVDETPKIHSEAAVKSKKFKVIKTLDNLETAAAKLLEAGQDLTGTSVGQALERPVSAPAITEYLRKNARYVGMLLDEHVDKWKIIRTDFRPLVNVKEKLRNKRNTG